MDKYTKRGTDGSVDVQASARAYAEALTKWAVENEIPSDQIADAVNTVLDSHSGRVPMPALLSSATQAMGATLDTYKVISDRVRAYVKGQADAKLLFVVKGNGGGVSREAPAKKSA
jgi:hypothetical protein